ncbi:MAG: dihydropteroate synthase [Propionibacteriaceae bacterium]|nr:dihydropteroate synthase [Propionibacteriaceae bacterium]
MSRPQALVSLFTPGPTRVMGILNVTPDSFAEPTHRTTAQAIAFGLSLRNQGAALVDVGAESTRPGAERVSEAEEIARALPVIDALVRAGVAVSIDTVRASVARAALQAGAVLVNDVSGGLVDPKILAVAAQYEAGYVLQHWRTPFDHRFTHTDVVAETCAELSERATIAIRAGIHPDKLILDPGIGFGKNTEQNWALVARADAISALGFKVLWGVSRKRFLSVVYSHPTEPWQRDAASAGVTALLAGRRVWAVRTHTVADHVNAIRSVEAARPAEVTRSAHAHRHPEANRSPRASRSTEAIRSPGASRSVDAVRSADALRSAQVARSTTEGIDGVPHPDDKAQDGGHA